MTRIEDSLKKIPWGTLVKATPFAIFALWSLSFAWVLWAEPPSQKTFSSPVQASRALFLAAQANDTHALLRIFGSDGKEIIFSGNAEEDKDRREQFVGKYQEMNRLVEEPDGTIWVYIGAENWPMPVPLVKKGDRWYFDTAAGKEEIRFRQIGRNEMTAVRVLHELVEAEKEYYAEPRDGEDKQYAHKLNSDEGRHNGLYWKISSGESESTIGPHLAHAARDSYPADSQSRATPFNGYYFQVLTKQGAQSPGGAKSYIVDGKMIAGFAFVAYPAEYATSGMMTFSVSQDGIVYQKDLGAKTTELAKALREYNPDKEWVRVE